MAACIHSTVDIENQKVCSKREQNPTHRGSPPCTYSRTSTYIHTMMEKLPRRDETLPTHAYLLYRG